MVLADQTRVRLSHKSILSPEPCWPARDEVQGGVGRQMSSSTLLFGQSVGDPFTRPQRRAQQPIGQSVSGPSPRASGCWVVAPGAPLKRGLTSPGVTGPHTHAWRWQAHACVANPRVRCASPGGGLRWDRGTGASQRWSRHASHMSAEAAFFQWLAQLRGLYRLGELLGVARTDVQTLQPLRVACQLGLQRRLGLLRQRRQVRGFCRGGRGEQQAGREAKRSDHVEEGEVGWGTTAASQPRGRRRQPI